MPLLIFGTLSCVTHSWRNCCHQKKSNKGSPLLSLPSCKFQLHSVWVQRSQKAQEVQYISPKIREQDLTPLPQSELNHVFPASVLPVCHSSPLSLLPEISFSLVFCLPLLPFPLPEVKPQHKFIGGGGMPVEVKRMSGSLSASPIILYGWSSGGAFITLNYTLRLLPLPPADARRPWPYHLIILPRRSVMWGTRDIQRNICLQHDSTADLWTLHPHIHNVWCMWHTTGLTGLFVESHNGLQRHIVWWACGNCIYVAQLHIYSVGLIRLKWSLHDWN